MDYVKRKYGFKSLSIFPGAGASSSDILISLALGFGRKFLIVADDDSEGRQAIKRYGTEYFIDQRACTLGELNPDLKGKKLEGILSPKTKDDMRKHLGVSKLQKKHTALFFQEMSATLEYELDEATKSVALTLLENMQARLNSLE